MCFAILTGFCAKLLYSRRIADHFLEGREKETAICSEKILNGFQGTKHLHNIFTSFSAQFVCSLHRWNCLFSKLVFSKVFSVFPAFSLNPGSIRTITKKHVFENGVESNKFVANSTFFSPSKMWRKLASWKNKIKCSQILSFSSKTFFSGKISMCGGNAWMGNKKLQNCK